MVIVNIENELNEKQKYTNSKIYIDLERPIFGRYIYVFIILEKLFWSILVQSFILLLAHVFCLLAYCLVFMIISFFASAKSEKALSVPSLFILGLIFFSLII